jgi:hypothetical protein
MLLNGLCYFLNGSFILYIYMVKDDYKMIDHKKKKTNDK